MPLASIELGPSPFRKRCKFDLTSSSQTTPSSNSNSRQSNDYKPESSAAAMRPVARPFLQNTLTGAQLSNNNNALESRLIHSTSRQAMHGDPAADRPPRKASLSNTNPVLSQEDNTTLNEKSTSSSSVIVMRQGDDVYEGRALQAPLSTAVATTALTTSQWWKKAASCRQLTKYNPLGDILARFSRPVPPSENLVRRRRPFLRTGLGKLPPEIREVIWGYVLLSQEANPMDTYVHQPITLTEAMSCVVLSEASPSCAQDQILCPALLRVCHLVHQEATHIYYANHRFRFMHAPSLAGFLNKIRMEYLLEITLLRLGGLSYEGPTFSKEFLHEKCRDGNLGFDYYEDLAAMTSDYEHPKATEAAAYLKQCKNLKTIHFDMKRGQEYVCVFFLLHIYGFGEAVVDFLDGFHWNARRSAEQYEEFLENLKVRVRPNWLDWGADGLGNDRLVEVKVGDHKAL